jgi:hypothetical protein
MKRTCTDYRCWRDGNGIELHSAEGLATRCSAINNEIKLIDGRPTLNSQGTRREGCNHLDCSLFYFNYKEKQRQCYNFDHKSFVFNFSNIM